MKCAYCGGAMVYGADQDKYRYYRCNNKAKGKCDKSNYVNLKAIETAILEQIKCDLLNLKFNLSRIPTRNTANEVYILDKQLTQLSNKLDRAQQAFLSGVDTIDEYKHNKATIQKEQQEVRNELEKAKKGSVDETHVKDKITSVYEYLSDPNNSMSDKNKAIKSIVSKITVDGPNKWCKITYFLDE